MWLFPCFQECCPICDQANCGAKHGFYYRPAFTEDNKSFIPDIPIQRYKCRTKRITFSLLPHQLIPYSKYPIKTITGIMDAWKKLGQNLSQTAMSIFSGENVCEELLNIDVSHLCRFVRLFKNSLRKYILWQGVNCSLGEFIGCCSRNGYRQARILAFDYYQHNGGYLSNSHLLFGKASQFRINPHSKDYKKPG